MQNTLTPWHPPHIKPVHVGVYETRVLGNLPCYQYWNTHSWSLVAFDQELAERDSDIRSSFQSPRWRGLAYPAKD